MTTSDDIILLGNFNLARLRWTVNEDAPCTYVPLRLMSSTESCFIDRMLGMGLFQLHNRRNSFGNFLDLVFASFHDDFQLHHPQASFCPQLMNTQCHSAVELFLQGHFSSHLEDETPLESQPQYRFDFARADYTSINRELHSIDCQTTLNAACVDDQVAKLYEIVLNRHAPRLKLSRRYARSWIDPPLTRLRNKRRKAYRRVCTTETSADYAV